jgi:hypothetical protein
MNTFWPDIINQKNIGFWRLEWKKHGTCTTFSQHDYFQATCDLTSSLGDLRVELQNNGLIATYLFFFFFLLSKTLIRV